MPLTFGQKKQDFAEKFEKIRQKYVRGEVEIAKVEAIELIKVNPEYVNTYLLLADIYNETGEIEKEFEILNKATAISDNQLINYRLGNSAYSMGKYRMALDYLQKYDTVVKLPEKKAQLEKMISNCKFAVEAMKNPVKFNPVRLPETINTTDDEYWPAISIDGKKLVFTRLGKSDRYITSEDFYYSVLDSSGWKKAIPISEINTLKNEGAQTLSADGKLLFFSSCGRSGGAGSCDIYYSRNENGKWSIPKNAGFPVNTDSWDAQPSFSSDYKYLYFSSERNGGRGKKDLWRIRFNGFDDFGNIKWGNPQNLGDSINTPGDEISPFIHPNNKDLYFASDFHPEIKKLDLFVSKIFKDKFSTPVNLDYPINSLKNEQGLQISADGSIAFFASARDSRFKHDIYQFDIDMKIRPVQATYLKARVIDSDTKKPLEAEIELTDLFSADFETRTERTDTDGTIFMCIPSGTTYSLNVSKDGYLFFSQSLPLNDMKTIYKPYDFTIELIPVKTGYQLELYNIYFETDSFSILPVSEPELNRLVAFLRNNGTFSVEIQGHTDNSGISSTNLLLSEKRANSVLNYLISNGIVKERLTAKGYGDLLPVSDNNNQEGRRLNRRTTVRITGVL